MLCCPRYIWYEGLDGCSNQYFCFSRGLCWELWVGSIFTCPLGLWNIDRQAHPRLDLHQYSLWTSVNGLHVYIQTLPFSNVPLGWTWTPGFVFYIVQGNWRLPISFWPFSPQRQRYDTWNLHITSFVRLQVLQGWSWYCSETSFPHFPMSVQ